MSGQQGFKAELFPLVGRRLIEASAGTGKTYNIANLYLRLVVGDDCLPKTVDQILVVTFTRAATSELRGRIREKIEQALHAFRGAECSDAFILGLLQRNESEQQKSVAARLLNNALLRMDEACIFTIHGFSVRAIQTFLFETGALADVEISEAGNARRDLLLADIWRQLQLSTHQRLLDYTHALGCKKASDFSRYFKNISAHTEIKPAFVIGYQAQALPEILGQLDAYVDDLFAKIIGERQQLLLRWDAICSKDGVPAIKLALGDSGNSKLFEKIESLLRSGEGRLALPSGKMLERLMAIHDSPSQDDLAQLARALVEHINNSVARETFMKNGFRALLLQYISARMSEADLSSMQLDEVISLINDILREEGQRASQLRRVVTDTYPICMVDEFQDTDPAQFEMFSRLYEGADGAGFFMIGDPKQSIYQFRGADIFSYLNVRAQVHKQEEETGKQHIFSLDTNFRSKSALVKATNQLFAEGEEKTFLFQGIDYVAVNSCEDEYPDINKGELTVGNKILTDKPLVFVGNNADVDSQTKFNGDTLRWQYAKDTAQRIAALLDASSGGKISKPNETERALRGGDIAVLVRTAREADAIRDALLAQTPRIASVYQSQRDSVFSSSIIADDIYHVLCAMDEPGNKSLLKKAMATLLYRGFSLDFADLDAIDGDDAQADAVFELKISEFSEYRACWEHYGVLTALQRLIQRQKLMDKIALLPDCDRLVTDLRHLGELLQDKSLECSSREQLILWFGRQLQDDSDLDEDSKRLRLESDENLVKIVTIHVSKGLEYGVVFLPFFFMPWQADSQKNIPLYHPEPDYHSLVDFSTQSSESNAAMQKEMLAEDMRLLYVAMTRAIYQCYIGISPAVKGREKMPLFPHSVWAHLLGLANQPNPAWDVIKVALQSKLHDTASTVDYRMLFDSSAIRNIDTASAMPSVELMARVSLPEYQRSNWIITSYTALAHARTEPGFQRGGFDENVTLTTTSENDYPVSDDIHWANNIRYRLKGSARTGDCLHMFFEELAKNPDLYIQGSAFDESLLQTCLRKHGLEKPEDFNPAGIRDEEREARYADRCKEIGVWLNTVLDSQMIAKNPDSTLRALFLQASVLPELRFDFSIGAESPAKIMDGINVALSTLDIAGISMPYQSELEGLITGSIDLLFIHNKKVYVLDYKSNTLGKSPRFYDNKNMEIAMKESRYDLQYLIYSVAAHRYMQQRLGSRYDFDQGEYSFGGVFYLFMRGMGLPDYPEHGIWFHRPERLHIEALDAAFSGKEMMHG